VVHAVVYLRLVEDKIPVVVAPVFDSVVRGVIELFDGGVEVVPPVVGNVEFDGMVRLTSIATSRADRSIISVRGSAGCRRSVHRQLSASSHE
jgi:hypothetical protein